MKKQFHMHIVALAALGLILTSCKPNPNDIKEVIEKDPSIVFSAIEKDPEKFIEVVNNAARQAQEKGAEKQAQDEQKKRDDEFANPIKPEINESRAFKGPMNAKVTIVEYSDFECPFCVRGYQTVKEVIKAYPNDVRILFKHLPLDFHPKALPAAKYFEAVALQSKEKAWELHDMIFENQGELKSKGEAFLKDSAKKLGLDMKKLEKDVASEEIAKVVQADIDEAGKFGINGTPGFVINGVSLRGAYPFPEFKAIIDRHLGIAATDKK